MSDQKKTVTIVVNGQSKEVEKDEITFKEVIVLAYGEYSNNEMIDYDVSYSRGHGNKPEGQLAEGESVKVKEGMVFTTTMTDRS